MMMRINPIQFIQMVRSGGNPQQMLNQIAANNPQYKQVLDAISGKTPAEMQEYTENLAKERGVDLNQLMSQLGIKK